MEGGDGASTDGFTAFQETIIEAAHFDDQYSVTEHQFPHPTTNSTELKSKLCYNRRPF